MLGRMTISRDGAPLELPASRKLLALFAYLSLAPRAVARTQLCELLWDVPNDPRGALRWCLSKIRRILDEPERRRVQTPSDAVQFDLSDCFVDATEVLRATDADMERLPSERLRALLLLFDGDFLEGLEIDRAPAFNGWLTAERRRFRGCHAALLEHLVGRVPDEQALEYLDKWLQLAPFDRRVHEKLLGALMRCNRIREAEAHLDATTQAFTDEGLDVAPIREAWRAARAQSSVSADAGRAAPAVARTADLIVSPGPRRASIAVMPFLDDSVVVSHAHGSALAHDVITRLAQLRSLFVIAQGTVFALHDRRIGPEEAGRLLNVDYIVSGAVRREPVSHAVRREPVSHAVRREPVSHAVRRDATRLIVSVELAETRSARIVWAEEFRHEPHDAFMVLDEIGNRIVASIASEIETVERNRAILKPPNSLDAWEAHHRGLWHMYRFTKPDNERAVQFFEMAVQLDPTFARAFAGLSLAHFQNAFQGWVDRERESDLAYDAAGKSLMVDDRDPAAHWAMGRALWLRGRLDQSVSEHERTIDLSPNFAMGHYSLSFIQSQGGDPHVAIKASDSARELSPFDPLLFGMLGTRAMALARLGRFDEAAEWAAKGAARVNAHPHALGIAALCLALAGSLDEARVHAATIRKALPNYTVDDFLGAFQFGAEDAAMFRRGAKRIDLG
jgi:DNA-binding SARP family transcriptional activator